MALSGWRNRKGLGCARLQEHADRTADAHASGAQLFVERRASGAIACGSRPAEPLVVRRRRVVGFWALDTGPGNAVARPEKSRRATPTAPSGRARRSGRACRLAPVRQVAFRDERATDGKIAINEDTTTPVFSPYLRPGQPPDRPAGRLRRARRAAVRHRGQRVRAGPQRSRHRRRRRREGALAARAGADRREAPARPAGDPRRRAEGPRAGAVRPRGARRATCAPPRSRSPPCATGCASSAARTRRSTSSRRSTASARRPSSSAPIGGTIIQRKVGLGQYINAGATDPVFTVGNLVDGVADRQRARVRTRPR